MGVGDVVVRAALAEAEEAEGFPEAEDAAEAAAAADLVEAEVAVSEGIEGAAAVAVSAAGEATGEDSGVDGEGRSDSIFVAIPSFSVLIIVTYSPHIN